METKVNHITVKSVATEWDVYFDMALVMLEEIMKNNALGKKTVMIVPVGPTNQYPILARLVNQLRVSLRDVWFFNMDEYMITKDTCIDFEDKMSFHKRMQDEFYSRVDADLIMPPEQRNFPMPGKELEYDALIESLGGVDLCLGGLGINGHVAFNEPPEEAGVTPDEFAALGTRVLAISRETRTINAYGYQRGDLYGMPEWCITLGMKQILSAKKVYIALNRPWQNGPLKHTILDAESAYVPASLLRRCPEVIFCGMEEVTKGIL